MDAAVVLRFIIVVIVAYFLGSLSFGWMVARLRGINILEEGSGNPGFTNVWRTLGIKWAVIVLFLDGLKGYLSACIGYHLAGEWGMMIGFVVAILGHSRSWMLHFRGGKGIATAGGALLYVSPLTLAILLVILALIVGTTKYMSLGSITVCIIAPFLLYFEDQPPVVIGVISCGVLYVIWLHRGNIKRLLNGTENKIGQKKRS